VKTIVSGGLISKKYIAHNNIGQKIAESEELWWGERLKIARNCKKNVLSCRQKKKNY